MNHHRHYYYYCHQYIFSSLNSLFFMTERSHSLNICCTDESKKKFHFINLKYNSTSYKMKQMESIEGRKKNSRIYSRYLSLLYKHHLLCVKKKRIWLNIEYGSEDIFWHWLKRHIRKFTFLRCSHSSQWMMMNAVINKISSSLFISEWLQTKKNHACWLTRKQTIDKFLSSTKINTSFITTHFHFLHSFFNLSHRNIFFSHLYAVIVM